MTSFVISGLGSAEAADRLLRGGPNELPRPRRRGPARRVLRQLRDPLVLVLLGVAAVTIAVGDHTDALVVALVVVGNTAAGVVQEVRADAAVAALDRLGAPRARVRRDAVVASVPAREIVVDDVVLVAGGDVVPADATVVAAEGLLVDEAAVTGESEPVARRPGDPVPCGGVVTRGRADLLVTATGAASAMGRTATLLVRTRTRATPLQEQMNGLGRRLAAGALLACSLVAVLGLLRGEPLLLVVITALSLAVAAVPESLPVVVTVGLALGARRMAARHAIVRGLPAVETLGDVTLLALDKTGTLTEGRPAVVEVHPADGYDVDDVARAAALATDAQPGADDAPGVDPTERALVRWAHERGLEPAAVRRAAPRERLEPFDARRRLSVGRHRLPDGSARVVALGAPETVIGPGDDAPAARLREWCDRAAARGLRVLVLAAGPPGDDAPDEPPTAHGLPVLGAVAMLDRPRRQAAAALARCRDAGIRPVVLTGDHPATAGAVARAVALVGDREARVLRSEDGDAAEADVVARCRPERKLELVRAWQSGGEVVAMTGDGINDGPALRRADIGIAMGEHGTEVARQAADLVLADDDLGTLVAAVEEGRRIHTNVRRFLCYALSGGAAEVLVMLLGPLVGVPLPLLPAQILWINLLTHGLPGVAFGAEPAEPGSLGSPPRRPGSSVFAGGLAGAILAQGSVITLATLAALLLDGGSRTAAFLTLGLAQLGVAVGLRAPRERRRPRGTDWLALAVVLATGAQVAAVTVGALQDLLGTAPVTAGAWGVAVAGAVVAAVVARLVGRPRVPAVHDRTKEGPSGPHRTRPPSAPLAG